MTLILFLETLNRTICQMQLSDVEFFYLFIKKKSESNFTNKIQDHKFQQYLSYLLTYLSYPILFLSTWKSPKLTSELIRKSLNIVARILAKGNRKERSFDDSQNDYFSAQVLRSLFQSWIYFTLKYSSRNEGFPSEMDGVRIPASLSSGHWSFS